MTVGGTNQSRSAADLIKRDDALAAIDRALNNPKRYATGDLFDCYAAIRALPAIDPAPAKQVTLSEAEAIREAALREAYEVVYKWWFGDGNALPQELILALIGEKK